jgi:hypothetical protein
MNSNPSNVTPITAAQPQASAKFSIACTIDGFPVSVEVEGKADNLRAMIDRLKAIGATPPQASRPEPPNNEEPPVQRQLPYPPATIRIPVPQASIVQNRPGSA